METKFINASRRKYRFNYKGQITTEDLWDLSVSALDSIYKSLRAEAKASDEEESLLAANTKTDTELDEKIDIIRYIVSCKMKEADERKAAAEQAQKRQKILALIDRKQNEALENLSIEELTRMLE